MQKKKQTKKNRKYTSYNLEKITKKHPYPFIEIHPRDAEKLSIDNGTWVKVRSRRGEGNFLTKITKAIAPGTVFVPMHWGALWAENSEANALTHPEACPDSLEPELKACAVQLVPLATQFASELPPMETLEPTAVG